LRIGRLATDTELPVGSLTNLDPGDRADVE